MTNENVVSGSFDLPRTRCVPTLYLNAIEWRFSVVYFTHQIQLLKTVAYNY